MLRKAPVLLPDQCENHKKMREAIKRKVINGSENALKIFRNTWTKFISNWNRVRPRDGVVKLC